MSHDGRRLAAVNDNILRIWNISNGVVEFKFSDSCVNFQSVSIIWSKDDARLIVSSLAPKLDTHRPFHVFVFSTIEQNDLNLDAYQLISHVTTNFDDGRYKMECFLMEQDTRLIYSISTKKKQLVGSFSVPKFDVECACSFVG